jgi:hypothetical protein
METPPPVSERPKIEGALPKAFGQGRNPLQMLNPWAPARYGFGWRTHRSIPTTPGNGMALSSSRSSFDFVEAFAAANACQFAPVLTAASTATAPR